MKVGFISTPTGMTFQQRKIFYYIIELFANDITEFHHGDCFWADVQAHKIIKQISSNIKIFTHPPKCQRFRAYCNSSQNISLEEKNYIPRNHDIADCELVIAAPKKLEALYSGTWDAIRYAKNQGRKIVIIQPDGTLVFFNCADIEKYILINISFAKKDITYESRLHNEIDEESCIKIIKMRSRSQL